MKPTVMIVGNEEVSPVVVGLLQQAGFQTSWVKIGAQSGEFTDGPQPDVLLLNADRLCDATFAILRRIKTQWADTEIILTVKQGIVAPISVSELGAFEIFCEPIWTTSLVISLKRASEFRRLKSENHSLRSEVQTLSDVTPPTGTSFVFESKAMREVVRMVQRVAPSDVPILITGESGTGKDLVTELIHTSSLRGNGPVVKVDCSAIPTESVDAELFGEVTNVRGNTQRERRGLLLQAQSGTVVLDRLSELPVTIQSKLARVLEQKEVFLLGGKVPTMVNCRVVASIQRPAEELIRDGKLREELYYQISAISVVLPPLRERREDVMPLANSFLKRFAAQANRVIGGFTPAAQDLLRKFDWPGNVRQLQNEVQRAVLMCEAKQVDAQDLSINAPRTDAPQDDTNLTLMEAMERNAIVQMLKETGGNKLETAKRLGIGRQTLYNKIKAYGIET